MSADFTAYASEALPLDEMPLGVRVGGRRRGSKPNPDGLRARAPRRPLSRFSQEEDGPSFYLSLSDLMSLLLVFFVLIFALTNPGPPLDVKPAPKMVKAIIAPPVTPVATEDPWPAPTAVPDDVRRGLAAVTGAGAPDPGLMSRDTRPKTKPDHGVTVSSKLLTLVTSSGQTASLGILPGGQRSLTALLNEVEQGMADGTTGVEMQRSADRLVLRLPEAITFDLGQARIKPAMHATLAKLAKTLAENNGLQIVITGHTDDLPINTPIFASNWELSGARAAAVARALMNHGMPAELFTIQGLADTKPVAPNTTPANRQTNRRVEIELRG